MEADRMLTINEVQQMLRISRSQAYRLIAQYDLPAVKIGRCVRVSKKDLDEWLKCRRYAEVIHKDAA